MAARQNARTERALHGDVRRALRRMRGDLVDFACEMIRVPSENPPGRSYARAARVISRRLRALGVPTRTIDPSGEGPCVYGTFGEGGRALYFSGHYDVVPAQRPDQFEPFVRKGYLHGRGSADMKGGIAAMVYAIHALRSTGFEPNGRLVSVSVPDEETSGPRGTQALARAGLVERDAIGMLTAEPTSDMVWNANRGVVSLRVTVRGRPAHVGLHFRGVNAFRGMLRVAGRFEALERRIAPRRTTHGIRPDRARHSILLIGGELSGGDNFNVVPDRASFTVDRRTNPEEDFATERERLFEVIRQARADGIACDAEVMQEGVASATPARGAFGRTFASTVRAVTGRTPRFEICPGVLETRHYAGIGIPAFAYGPGTLNVSHGPHELVSVEGLVRCAEVYALAAARLLA
jgi:succinyl-diaminopimelate desuccinylase